MDKEAKEQQETEAEEEGQKQQKQQKQQQKPRDQLQQPNIWRVAITLEAGNPIGLELNFSEEALNGTGIRVFRVNPGMAMNLGVLRDDRLTSIGGKDVRNSDVVTIREMLQKPCYPTELVFERGLQEDKGDGRVDEGAGKGADSPSSSLQKQRAHEVPATNEGAGSVSDKTVSHKRPREESDQGEDAAAQEVTQAARKKTFTRVVARVGGRSRLTEIERDEPREAAAAAGSRHAANEPRASQPPLETQPQREMVKKPAEVKHNKEQQKATKAQTLLEWKVGNGKKEENFPKSVVIGPPPRKRPQAVATEAAARQPIGVGKGGEGVEQQQKKKKQQPGSSSSSFAAAPSPPWLGQLISLELGGMAGTNSARAAVMMNEVREMLVKELETLQKAGKLSQHLTRPEYAVFRGVGLNSSAGYMTLKKLSDQYLVDHDDELAEIAEADFLPDLLGNGALKEMVLPAAAAAATASPEPVKDGEHRSGPSPNPVGSSPGLEIAKKTPSRVKFVLKSHERVQAVVMRALACHQQAVTTANNHRMIRKRSLLDVKEARKESKKTERQAEIVIARIRGWQKAALVSESMAVDLSGFVTQRAEMLRDAMEFLMGGLEMQKVASERLGVFHLLREEAVSRTGSN